MKVFNRIKDIYKNKITQRHIFTCVVKIYEIISPILLLCVLRMVLESLNDVFNILIWNNKADADKVYNFIAILVFIYIVRKKYKNISLKTVLGGIHKNIKLFLLGLVFSAVINSFATMLGYIPFLHKYLFTMFKTQSYNIEGANSLISIINIVLFTPIVEEYIFRKVIFEKIYNSKFRTKAILITSMLFALIHCTSFVLFVFGFAFSILLCNIYIRYGYYGSLSAHVGFNFLTIINYFINIALGFIRFDKAVALFLYIFYFVFGVMLMYIFLKEKKL